MKQRERRDQGLEARVTALEKRFQGKSTFIRSTWAFVENMTIIRTSASLEGMNARVTTRAFMEIDEEMNVHVLRKNEIQLFDSANLITTYEEQELTKGRA